MMKLIIKPQLLSKICYINSQINTVEWMGVFIYKTKGKFPEEFIIEGHDVILMAKGSAAEVGYITDVDLMETICDLGYEEYSRGMIHHHHILSTNFSTTDTDQL